MCQIRLTYGYMAISALLLGGALRNEYSKVHDEYNIVIQLSLVWRATFCASVSNTNSEAPGVVVSVGRSTSRPWVQFPVEAR